MPRLPLALAGGGVGVIVDILCFVVSVDVSAEKNSVLISYSNLYLFVKKGVVHPCGSKSKVCSIKYVK